MSDADREFWAKTVGLALLMQRRREDEYMRMLFNGSEVAVGHFDELWGASNAPPEHPEGPRWLRRQRARQQRNRTERNRTCRNQ